MSKKTNIIVLSSLALLIITTLLLASYSTTVLAQVHVNSKSTLKDTYLSAAEGGSSSSSSSKNNPVSLSSINNSLDVMPNISSASSQGIWHSAMVDE